MTLSLPSHASSQATLSIPVHQGMGSLDPVSFPSILLHYTTAKMNGRLWEQMKTQLCGSKQDSVTDKCGKDLLFHRMLIFWNMKSGAASLFWITLHPHVHLYSCSKLCLSFVWPSSVKDKHKFQGFSSRHCQDVVSQFDTYITEILVFYIM